MFVIEEGFRERSQQGVTGWICASCWHFASFTRLGVCANCHVAGALYEVKTPERTREETEARLDQQRFQPLQRDFDPFEPLSQMGKALTTSQLVALLNRYVPIVAKRGNFNKHLGRFLTALYVPYPSPKPSDTLSETERKEGLRFVCACEEGLMPEWDIITRDEKRLPIGLVRGWRSVLANFYRAGLIPFVPDDGRRLSYHQIRHSPLPGRF